MSATTRTAEGLARLLAALILSGCATTSEVRDPIEPFNRAMFSFNEYADRYFMRPGAIAYSAVTPKPIQQGVGNFFRNLRTVDSAVASFLQGKAKKGAVEVGRMVINTTFGIGGLIDVARKVGLEAQHEDMGQTFAVWAWENPPYLVLPLLGPSNLRDGPDHALQQIFLPPLILPFYNPALRAIDGLQQRTEQMDATDARDDMALDKYVFTREAFMQRRRFLVYDGDPPAEDFDDLLDELDEAQ
ncbi:MAG: VacJ family lipoprotein [Pseudomonadales bacterium]